MTDIPILLEESSFLVVAKPSGLFTQAARGVPSLETLLVDQLSRLAADLLRKKEGPDHETLRTPGKPFVGLPHRLDRGTSGALLIARNERSLKRFGLQFQSRKVEKTYWAVSEGSLESNQIDPSFEEGTWVDWMRKIPDRPVAEIVAQEHPEAKKAILHFKRIAVGEGLSLFEIRLETGRMHQIRLQLAHRGFPVVGDWCYGSNRRWGVADAEGRWTQLCLHAREIVFRHPLSGVPVRVQAPVEANWDQLPPSIRDRIQ